MKKTGKVSLHKEGKLARVTFYWNYGKKVSDRKRRSSEDSCYFVYDYFISLHRAVTAYKK